MRLTGEKGRSIAPEVKALLVSDLGRAARRYLVVGGVSALADWAIFAAVLYGLDLHYILAGTISFVIATGLNYFLSVRFVFGNGRRRRHQRIFLLYMVSVIGVGFNLGLLSVGIDVLGLHPMLSKMIATGMVLGWNFVARYYFVFQK